MHPPVVDWSQPPAPKDLTLFKIAPQGAGIGTLKLSTLTSALDPA